MPDERPGSMGHWGYLSKNSESLVFDEYFDNFAHYAYIVMNILINVYILIDMDKILPMDLPNPILLPILVEAQTENGHHV